MTENNLTNIPKKEDRFTELPTQLQFKVICTLRRYRDSISEMLYLWYEHQFLNDKLDISTLIPMSLEELFAEIDHKIEDYQQRYDKSLGIGD